MPKSHASETNSKDELRSGALSTRSMSVRSCLTPENACWHFSSQTNALLGDCTLVRGKHSGGIALNEGPEIIGESPESTSAHADPLEQASL